MTRTDVTCAIAFTCLQSKQAKTVSEHSYPALESHCIRCETLPEFRAAAYSDKEAKRSGWREAWV
jgi:hypothetical protein